MVQEPFITVSVAICEGRREKRGGGAGIETRDNGGRKEQKLSSERVGPRAGYVLLGEP